MQILKNIKKNTIILVGVTLIILYLVLRKDLTTIVNNLATIDLRYIFLALICFTIYLISHSYVVYLTVNKKENFSFLEAIKHNVIAQFFNGITPFSTGGQPMEIYMLTKHKISLLKSTNYILQNFIFYQIALVLLGIVAVILNLTFHLFPKNPLLGKLVFIGFIVNTLVAIILLFISLSTKTIHKLTNYLINLLYKLNFIKDKEATSQKWSDRINEFHECANELKKRKGLFIVGIILNFIGLICLYIIPLFIVYALHDFTNLNIINTLTASAYVMVMGSFIPIPGASGGIEYGFTQFFGNFLSQSKTTTVLLLWRTITYYLGLIIGAVAFNFDKDEVKEEKIS